MNSDWPDHGHNTKNQNTHIENSYHQHHPSMEKTVNVYGFK